MTNLEVTILVPEKRLAEFYRLYADWLESDKAKPKSEATARSRKAKAPSRRARAARSGSQRYAPLLKHLSERTEDERELELSFAQLEEILGAPLPPSARTHRAWWANAKANARAAGWMEAGWKVAGVDLEGGRVRFARAAG